MKPSPRTPPRSINHILNTERRRIEARIAILILTMLGACGCDKYGTSHT